MRSEQLPEFKKNRAGLARVSPAFFFIGPKNGPVLGAHWDF
jgi:hypothetical protein